MNTKIAPKWWIIYLKVQNVVLFGKINENLQFCIQMNRIKNIFSRLSRDLKFSISNPNSFKENWSVTSSGLRVLSLILIFLVLFGLLIGFILQSSFVQSYLSQNDTSIERDKLEEQNEKILELEKKILGQENYLLNVQYLISGKVPFNTPMDSVQSIRDTVVAAQFDTKLTSEERKINDKVKEDMTTKIAGSNAKPLVYYGSPVLGVISQTFDSNNHFGVDVVTKKGEVVKACLAGTIIYAGYTHKDGYIIIIEHKNDVVSVYRHNQRVLKKTGSAVKLGDPIAIVGNTGENTDGPHLHFELWQNQIPVNPTDFIQFTR